MHADRTHADGVLASLPSQDADTGLSASLLSGEIYAFLLLGVLCGVLGAAFVHATASTILLVRKLRVSLSKPQGRAGASCSGGGSGGGGSGSGSGGSSRGSPACRCRWGDGGGRVRAARGGTGSPACRCRCPAVG